MGDERVSLQIHKKNDTPIYPLQCHTVKLSGDKYAVTVTGFGEGDDATKEALVTIDKVLTETSNVQRQSPVHWGGADRILRVRLANASIDRGDARISLADQISKVPTFSKCH